CRLGLVLPVYTCAFGFSSLAPKGYASSLGFWLVVREPRQSPSAGVDFLSLVELQLLGVCCDISRGVIYPRSGDLIWLASLGGASLFVSASFHSSADSLVVDTCTKAVVGARCCPESVPPTVKSVR
ncbi:hypothetical protein BHM03_00061431, partial [Ensete ventricosum]